jgi:hypothetical protein
MHRPDRSLPALRDPGRAAKGILEATGTMRRHGSGWHRAVASRPWTSAERRVVLRGFWGRLSIAIEPLIVAMFFSLLPIALVLRKQEAALLLAPIFGFGAVAFSAYAVVLMLPSTRALFETFGRIYSVDGYVRYRGDELGRYHAAVLDAERAVLGEWELSGRPRALDVRDTWPALVEYCSYAGILRIDGRSTGVLPERIPPLGIGAAQSFADAQRDEVTGAEPSSN